MSNADTKQNLPTLPLPPPILSLTEGTWAYDTMSRRVNKDILQRTLDENPEFLTPPFQTALESYQALRDELTAAATTPLRHLLPTSYTVGDEGDWHNLLAPHVSSQSTWLSTPWLIAEFYLYRRLLEALGYFDPSSPGYNYDPFLNQKRSGLHASPPAAEGVLEKVDQIMTKYSLESLGIMTSIALWGNQMDLSIWPTGMNDKEENVLLQNVLQTNHENLLWDDTLKLKEYCDGILNKGTNVDIIVDNAGLELVTDLILADYLIQSGLTKQVTFRLKSHPTFVSDAMEKDLRETAEFYAQQEGFCGFAGKRWVKYLENNKWVCKEDNFWVQPFAMWDMPQALRSDMSKSDLAIVKGDANYRRLLGDLEWDLVDASFQNVVGDYFPCPVLALRTLKAELGCGMVKEKVEWAKGRDDNWMVNGKYGVVHLGIPRDN
eukprot:CAMPEP_0172509890 /NCGR_PEP_ID=MMETSP1066-20121228/224210_1 /TAXON_ID=671091 /ORGANISM="Coscinodiscus wailesii, Strain CCMP2513" /LENGTH=433 /DNA_ID=CAMNT_0013288601 /DNA_START=226 /DNA_END=1527 /DNA_ORIENTATION=-